MVNASSYLENIRFLHVDGNAFARSTLKTILGVFGGRDVREAHDADEAIKLLSDWRPDILVTENRLQGSIGGIDLIRHVRTSPHSPDQFMPVLMLSACSEMQCVVAARDAGVTEYVIKPYSAKQIMRRVVEIIEKPRPFVDGPGFFGPERRRRRADVPADMDRRHAEPVHRDGAESRNRLTQYQIDRLVAGQDVTERIPRSPYMAVAAA